MGYGGYRASHGGGGYTGRHMADAQRSELTSTTQKFRMPDGTPNKKVRWGLGALGLLSVIGLFALVSYLVPDRNVQYSLTSLGCTAVDDTMEFSATGLTILDDQYETYEVRIVLLDLGTEVAITTVIVESRGPLDITETLDFYSTRIRDTCEIEVKGLTP